VNTHLKDFLLLSHISPVFSGFHINFFFTVVAGGGAT